MAEEIRITSFQLYLFEDPRDLPDGACAKNDANCRYGLLRIACCGRVGWSECVLSENKKYFDLAQWAAFLQYFHKPTLTEAYETVDHLHDRWGDTKSELVRSALNDLNSQFQNDNSGSHRRRSRSAYRYSMDPASLMEHCRAHYEIV
jgi:hypothetical protein